MDFTLSEYINALLNKSYAADTKGMMKALRQMSESVEVQRALDALEIYAEGNTMVMTTPELSKALAVIQKEMNFAQGLVIEVAPNLAESGAEIANRATTAKLFGSVTDSLLLQNVNPLEASIYKMFLKLAAERNIPFDAPIPSEMANKFVTSQAWIDRMEGWGDGYSSLIRDRIKQGLDEGWSPIKVAREIRQFATTMPRYAAENIARTTQLHSYREATAEIENRMGKFIEKKIRIAALDMRTCFPAGTKIKTPTGYKNIEDVKVGDLILTHELNYEPVTELFEREYQDDFIVTETKHGRLLECTKDHPVLVVRGRIYKWVFAKDIEVGDGVLVANDDSSHNVFHALGNVAIKRRIRNANDNASLFDKVVSFPSVGFGTLAMPVDAINFDNAIVRNKKVNGISAYFLFLYKRASNFLKTHPKVSFGLGLVLIGMIAGGGAILSGMSFGVLFTTLYRELFSAMSTANGNPFISPCSLTLSGTVVVVAVLYAFFVNKKFLSAVSADSGNLAGSGDGSKALIRTVFLGSTAGTFGSASVVDSSARNANPFISLRGELWHSKGVIAFKGTKRARSLARGYRKTFTTLLTDYFYAHDIIISKTTIPVKSMVYNIEAHKDNTYFANDILVHNCPACIALHGTEVPVGVEISDHYNGRCDAIYIPPGGEMPSYMQSMSTPGNRNFVPFQNGEDWFAGLSESQQRQILGPGKFEIYRSGTPLSEFWHTHTDSVFGDMPGVKPLWMMQGYGSYAEKVRSAFEDELLFGYPKSKIIMINDPGYEFKVGDKTFTAGGHYDPRTDKITIFNWDSMHDMQKEYLMTHEVQHAKFHYWEEKASAEWQALKKEYPVGGESPYTGYGYLKPEVLEKYPALAIKEKFFDNWDIIDELTEKDGVSPYSTAYWQAADRTYKNRVDETLAEIAKEYWNYNDKAMFDEAVDSLWKELYYAINRLYENR